MNKQPVVAVSQRVDVWAERGERRDALDQRLSSLLQASGVLPVPVPNALSVEASATESVALTAWMEAIRPDGILLSGGNDIGESIERDNTERLLLNFARDNKLPVLGICRGMQMMAVWAGGALVRTDGHVRTRHVLTVADGSGEWPAEVNSFHNFALEECPEDFSIVAQAEDGTIEAMSHVALPWEGWMWHPERETVFSLADINRLKALFHVSSMA